MGPGPEIPQLVQEQHLHLTLRVQTYEAYARQVSYLFPWQLAVRQAYFLDRGQPWCGVPLSFRLGAFRNAKWSHTTLEFANSSPESFERRRSISVCTSTLIRSMFVWIANYPRLYTDHVRGTSLLYRRSSKLHLHRYPDIRSQLFYTVLGSWHVMVDLQWSDDAFHHNIHCSSRWSGPQ